MTIKRRLFISNILMLVIPMLLSVTVISFMMFAVANILGISYNNDERGLYYHTVAQVRELVEEWSSDKDIEQIKLEMDKFASNFDSDNLSLSIYLDGEQQYTVGNSVDHSFIELILLEDGDHNFSIDNTGIHKTDVGKYTILLVGTNIQNARELDYVEYYQYLPKIAIFIVIIVIAIIIVTNRLLTRMVIKRIITPLDALVYGVHQIQEGNLSHHIEYKGNDEFFTICNDFNEMAQRLLDMVNARQKDDENRRELIAGISHDLRTPLTSIKAYIEGLEKGVAATPHIQKRYLDTIKSKTDDLEHIVSQLFLFSKLDIGEFPFQMEIFDIGNELSEFIKAVSEEYGNKGLQIDLVKTVQGVKVNVDRVQLRNVLTNILENSLKYGNKECGVIRITCQTDHTNVNITLTDNGSGVPDDVLEKLFYIFYRNDKARSNTSQGSGLGLAISAKIMERLGGAIRAENVAESGLSITLTLPIMKEKNKIERKYR